MEAKTTEWRPGPTVCRCCLTEGCYKDISTEYFWMGKREVYSEMLSETLDLNIAYSQSGGPNSNSRLICEPCISRLRDATDFKRQVLECERSFMQYLDPVGSGDIGVNLELDKDVKIERVKDEKTLLDDDDDEFVPPEFGDEDDDDLDDQPLTKLASKIPKKESVDVLDLLDNAKITEKRKSSSKSKSSPAKKSKLKKEVASSSKVKPEPRKKKGSANADMPGKVGVKPIRKLKENVCARQMRRRRRANNEFPEESDKRIAKTMMRRNAITLLECSTAWAFRWFQSAFYCSYCDDKFIETLHLRKHVRTLHINHAPTKHIFSKLTENNMVKIDVSDLHCRMCDCKIESIDTLKKHLMTIHEKKIYTNFNDGVLPFKLDENRFNCQKCSLIFTSFSKINEHMNTHYQNYVCDTCGKAFVSKSRFRTHVQSHEIGSFPCGECDEVLETRAARMCHKLKIHRNGIRYTCPRCPEVFTTYYARAKHLVDGHDQQKVDYQCSSCGKIFETSCKRTAHIRMTHTANENKYRCPNCSWYFVSKSKLKRHISTHDSYENINDFSNNK